MINHSTKNIKSNTHVTKPVINSDNFIVKTKEINSYDLDLFLKTLFQRKFGVENGLGRIFVSTKNNDNWKNEYFDEYEPLRAYLDENSTKGENVYVGVNLYQQTERKDADKISQLSCIYIDLDAHDSCISCVERDEIICRTQDMINSYCKNYVLPIPTIVSRTGRGISMLYVLEKSIFAIKGCSGCSEKQVNYFYLIRDFLLSKIENCLKAATEETKQKFLTVDKSVTKDDSRVCRIPGSVNTKTGTKCQTTAINGLVTLDYLASYFTTELNTYHRDKEDKHNKKKAIVKTIHVENGVSETFIPRAAKRCEAVLNWLVENNNHSVGYRNNLCFIYLNSFLQVVGLDCDAAYEALRALNENFITPLPDREIKALVKSAFKNRYSSEKGSYEKYFRISNRKIMDLLDLDEDGMIHYGFSEKKRGLKKEQAEKRAIERAEKKANLEKLVVKYFFDESNNYTYKKIAEMAGTSERTVRRILKSKKLTRYDRKKQNVNEKSYLDSKTEEKKGLILDEKTKK